MHYKTQLRKKRLRKTKKQRTTRVNSGRINRSCSTSDRRRVTVQPHEYHLTRKSCCKSVSVNKYKGNKLTITPHHHHPSPTQYTLEYRRTTHRSYAYIFLQFLYITHVLRSALSVLRNLLRNVERNNIHTIDCLYSRTSLARTRMARTIFLVTSILPLIPYQIKLAFFEHQYPEQSNYFYGQIMINQYKLPLQTRTQIHQKCQALY